MATTTKMSYWCCNHCLHTIVHGEFRFNCTVCEDYDLCEKCVVTLDPPHPHQMIRDLAYGNEEVIKDWEWSEFTMASNIQLAAAMYHDRYCMGVRDIDKTNPLLYTDTFSWLTFETVGIRCKNFGNGLRNLIEPRNYLGICAGNRPEWVITDFACILQSIISVPIYCLFTDRELTYIVNNTNVSVVVCDKQMLPRFIQLHANCPSLRHIVCMDSIPEAILGKYRQLFPLKMSRPFSVGMENSNLRVHYMGDVENNGSTKQYNTVTFSTNECLTIIYTSGSSGFPKGAIISESVYLNTLSDWCTPFASDFINFSYEPLAWASGRDAIIRTFFRGGRTGFSTGDASRLMEDLALVRPNNFSATPTIWNKIYAEYKAALALATAHLSSEAVAAEEERLLRQFSKLVPKRCKTITYGGPMISPVVINFIQRCFTHCHIRESYGITECGSVANNSAIHDALQFHLVSVPEMGYTIDDEPFARGELYIKSTEMFSGYINNPEETEAALTEDGFFRTGDIVELRPDSHDQLCVHVIDRKKNFFKLSQGLFVSAEFLQSIYIQSPFVEQIYIHGDLLADSVAAVVVPNREYAYAFALEHNLPNFNMNNPGPKFHGAILRDLHLLAEKESLRKHERPSRLIIDFEPFTPENGLLTSTMKPCRYKLAAHYGDRIKESKTIEEQLKIIIETTTGQSLSIDNEDNVFLPTAGDSLTAVRLSRIIENDLGISVSINVLLEPNITLEQLATVIKDPSQISSVSHSITSQLLNDSQMDLDIKVGEYKNTVATPSMIFITGTTGFVGAFLLAELLSVYSSECKFACLVRCESMTNPLDRIRQNMLFYQIWKEDFQNRIIPIQGDLAKIRFGLDIETYESLAHKIDIIFHCGAVVNFVLPYSTLYNSNVGGTREIIRLATHTSTCIPIHYISTLSVLSSNINNEVWIDETSPDDLVNGYAQSKWVAEKLMANASRLGVPVVIYRLGSICASTETGACNQHDLHTLLFAAIMKLNCYPETLVNAHLYGLPANFTAKSIVYLSSTQRSRYGKIYHVLNPNNEILFADIIDSMHRCDLQVKSISLEEWRMKLKTISDDQDSPLQSIGEFIRENSFDERCQISAEQFYNSISALDLPSIDNIYVIKWINFILKNILKVSTE